MASASAALPHLRNSAPIDSIEAALSEFGALIIDDLVDPHTLARFNAELDPLLDVADPTRTFVNPLIESFHGGRTRHIAGVAAKSRVFATEILTNPTLTGIADSVLLPNCARYQLNLAHVLDRGPGSTQQYLHRDEIVWFHMPSPHPELQIASVIALVDFTAANGATRIAPGSNRWSAEREPTPDDLVAAEMPAGSAVVYLGSTIHGGGPNSTSDNWRRGMHLSFTLGWLRTEENNYLATPPEVARTLPVEAQALLGYAAHDAIADGGGYLGTLDLRDPLELFDSGEL